MAELARIDDRSTGMATSARAGAALDTASRFESLLTYPSLARLFEGDGPGSLMEMRDRLTQSHRSLERLIRQGSRQDASRATRIAKSFDLTLKLLAELERSKSNL